MNLAELETEARRLAADKARGLPLLDHEQTRDRLTRARMRDLGTHVRSIVAALGRGSAADVAASELTDAAAECVREDLTTQDKKKGVIDSTMGSFRLLRDLAIELGETIMLAGKAERPTRNRVYRRCESQGRHVKIARGTFIVDNTPYGLRRADWPDALRREYDEGIWPFFCDPVAENRSQKREASPAYMKTWVNRAERAFGYLVNVRGLPVASLSFKTLMDYDVLLGYYRWLYQRRGNVHTDSTKGDLDQWRHLANRYYEMPELAEKLRKLIYDRTTWQKVKDKQELALRVHADDLYTMFAALVAEAEHYEANVSRKYGRLNPHGTAAHKWMEAGVVGLTIMTWLREHNIATCTPRNLYKQEDGAWYFRFPRGQMKSKRDHADHVIDLWRGREAQAMIARVLDRCVELRPHLIERFRAAHPGKPDPETFFLNLRGRNYSHAAVRLLFASASQRYLGPGKRLSPHDVRTIVPSWLFVREGVEILPTVQRRLDHAHIQTTHQFYLKVERVFDSRMAQARMEERAKVRRTQEKLHRLPEEMMAMFLRMKDELVALQGEASAPVDPAALRAALAELLGLGDGDVGKAS